MRRGQKIALITALVLILVGAAIFVNAFRALDYRFGALSTEEYETTTHEVRESFDSIMIDNSISRITFQPSADGVCSVVCHDSTKRQHTVDVRDGTLVIKEVDERKWYEQIGVFTETPWMTISLPAKAYAALTVETDTGDIELPAGLSFDTCRLHGDTSDISLSASVGRELEIRTSTGEILLEGQRTDAVTLTSSTGRVTLRDLAVTGALSVKTSTGRIELQSVTCGSFGADTDTGRLTLTELLVSDELSIETDTGDVLLDNSDAASIRIKTDTGDVTAALRSPKVFVTKSSTGKIDVPDSTTGGKCEITTSTGDIRVSLS